MRVRAAIARSTVVLIARPFQTGLSRNDWLAHVSRTQVLRAPRARIVIACGVAAPESAPHRAAAALAERLGGPPVEFPGGHTGWLLRPKGFAQDFAFSLSV
jgi:hypothetical protein